MSKKGDSKIPNHHFKTGRELTRETIKAFERLTETFSRHIRQYAHMHLHFISTVISRVLSFDH